MRVRFFHNTFIADLSGKWKLSRVLTPFVTGPEDKKSYRVIGTVFNVLYCLSIIIVCYLAYLNKGKTGLVITFFIFAVCGAICQTISIRIKKKAGRPASSVKSLEACFKNKGNTAYTFAVGCSCRQALIRLYYSHKHKGNALRAVSPLLKHSQKMDYREDDIRTVIAIPTAALLILFSSSYLHYRNSSIYWGNRTYELAAKQGEENSGDLYQYVQENFSDSTKQEIKNRIRNAERRLRKERSGK